MEHRRLKILFVGNTRSPWCTEVHLGLSYRDLGHEVVHVQEDEVTAEQLLERVRSERPDILQWQRTWGLKGDALRMLAECKALGIPTVAYHLDLYAPILRGRAVPADPWWQCVPESATVATSSVRAVFRRPYSGILVGIRAGEHEFSATPNHPVLTTRGWVAAGEISEGDYVIGSNGTHRTGARGPHVKNGPNIEKIYEAGSDGADTLPGRRQRVGSIPMDFHGDGAADDKIDAVRTDGNLVVDDLAASSQPRAQLALLLGAAGEMKLPQPRADLATRTTETHDTGRALRALRNSGLFENRLDGPTRAIPNGGSNRGRDFACEIPGRDQVSDERMSLGGAFTLPPSVGTYDRAESPQISVNERDRTSMQIGEILDRGAGLVRAAKVSKTWRHRYDGHVFNLSTGSGAFVSDGIVTHNCAHVFTPDGGSDPFWLEHGINHRYAPPGVYAGACYRAEPDPAQAVDVAFVGSYDYHAEWPWRRQLIDWLRKTYGPRFRLVPGPGNPAVREHALNVFYASAKVCIGDSLVPGFTHPTYTSDRLFETTGRGGFIVYPRIKGVTDGTLVTEGEHVACYSFGDLDGLKRTIDYYLERDAEREAIRVAGHEHAKATATYAIRMQAVIDLLRAEGAIR